MNNEFRFFFLHEIDFPKILTDLEFLIIRLFDSFTQYRKKAALKDFVLQKMGLITEADNDLKRYFI